MLVTTLKYWGDKLCGITHVGPVDGKVMTAAEHHEQLPECLGKNYRDLFQIVYGVPQKEFWSL